MRREFLINIVFLVTINLLIKPFYIFGIDRGVQNEVGPESFGLYWALFNFVYLFQVINDLGLQNFSATYISQNRSRSTKYFGHIAAVKLLASTVFSVLVIIVARIIGYGELLWPLLSFLIFNQILISLVSFLRANIAGLGNYRLDSFSSILDRAFMIIICGVLLWGVSIDFEIMHFVLAQTVSLSITVVILGFFLRRSLPSLRIKWHLPTLWTFVRKSAPYALTFVLTTLYTRVDAVMLERLLVNGDHESGVYVSGYRLLEASNMFIYLFIGLLLPMFSYLHARKEESRALFHVGFKIIWVTAMILSALAFYFQAPIMALLYEHAQADWAPVMGVLMLGFIGMAIAHLCGAYLLANHRVYLCNYVYATGMVINIGLNLWLIPIYGALGAAQATLMTQGFVAVGSLFLILVQLNVRFSILDIARYLIFSIVVWLGLHQFMSFTSQSHWIYSFVGFGLLFAVLAMIMGLFPVKQILRRTAQ